SSANGGRQTAECGFPPYMRRLTRLSTGADKFVDTAILRQPGIDVALRVDADAVDVAARQLGEHVALRAAHCAIGRVAAILLLGDVPVAVLAAADVVGTAHSGPLAQIP